MRLSYLLTARHDPAAVRKILARLSEITPLPRGQWEICLGPETPAYGSAEAIRAEFPNVRLPAKDEPNAACSGQYVIPLGEHAGPADAAALRSILCHLDSDPTIGAVAGKLMRPNGVIQGPALPSLVKLAASCFRKSVVDRIGGFPAIGGSAADYDLSFRILGAGFRIDRRHDIVFQGLAKTADESSGAVAEVAEQLAVASRYLPLKLRQIYSQDWATKYRALAAQGGKKRAGHLAVLLARLQSIRQIISAPDPVGQDVLEAVFAFRTHATLIGDWARRGSVWRVVLADFTDNVWATYNACRSTGLQMRCLADNNPAFENLSYRDLPIVPANRAFEGGGIDGVILTSSEPSGIESNFKSLRNYFHGPILRLCQTPRQATHAQAVAA
ncbi:MAG: hypothetical protein ABSC42_14620 [Tepidisphaeraceae bacterium]|jgi:hypothetical protein